MKTCFLPIALLLLPVPYLLADNAAPVITAAAVSPDSVDITGGGASVTATLTITDDASGVKWANLYLYSPSGEYVNSAFITPANRVSGDALDGTYEVTVTVPEFGAPGNWRLDGLVTDNDDNTRYYNPSPGGTPFPVPGDMEIAVTNSGTVDADPPDLTSAAVLPEQVNVLSSPAVITFTIECGDTLSGFDYGFIYPRNPANHVEENLITYFADFSRVSGDPSSGTYEVGITLPQGSQPGEWSFELYLKDRVGNAGFHPGGVFTVTSGVPASAATFLGHALDAVHLPFTTAGTGWFIGVNETNDGIDSAWPRPVPDGGSSTMSTTVTGPGTLRFFWRVSSEEDDDFLSVDIPSASIHHEISGETFWEEMVLTIPPGTHPVTWAYIKGASGSDNQDMAWVDQVGFVAQSLDSELPRLQALRIRPSRVDAGNPEDVTVIMEITDDYLGLASGRIELVILPGTLRTPCSSIPSIGCPAMNNRVCMK
jgi:hypothetical protein